MFIDVPINLDAASSKTIDEINFLEHSKSKKYYSLHRIHSEEFGKFSALSNK